jgi:hypothetical protein
MVLTGIEGTLILQPLLPSQLVLAARAHLAFEGAVPVTHDFAVEALDRVT